MRVIGGSRKRMPLETIKGMETRPTTDRIKETLFNMLQPEIYQCRFLDLFAGSGQMGIEALSRGAREAVFVEKNPAAARCIKRNLAFTRLEETGRLYTRDVMDFLQHPGGEEPFDLIFLDPPYDKGLEEKAFEHILRGLKIQGVRNVIFLTDDANEEAKNLSLSFGFQFTGKSEHNECCYALAL